MNDRFGQIIKHTIRYWFEDGISEINVGGLFVLIGIFVLLQGMFESGSFLAGFSGFAGAILMGLGIWAARSLTTTLKERITYPRTGYVSYHQPGRFQRWLSVFLGGFGAAFLVWLIRSYPDVIQAWMPLIEGLAMALFAFTIGQRTGLFRFYFLMLFAVFSGTCLSLYSASDLTGTGWFFISMGLVLASLGLIVLTRYLRESKPSSGASNGN